VALEARSYSTGREIVVSLLAAALSLLSVAVLILLAGANPLTGFAIMFAAAFGGKLAFTETLVKAAPMVLTGLAALVAFRVKFWNIGGEGQLLVGAMAAAYLGASPLVPESLLIPAMIVGSAVGGAAAASVPGFLKVRLEADEVVSTLMLNFIIAYIMMALLTGPWKDPVTGWTDSPDILPAAEWSTFWRGTRLHLGVLLAIGCTLAVALALRQTTFGLAIDIVGSNPRAAQVAGLPAKLVTLGAVLLSGALAGLAGAGEVGGIHFQVMSSISPGYGYAGIAVAMLARLSPLGVLPAALFFAAIVTGSDQMSRELGVPVFLGDAVQGMSLLAVLVAAALSRYRLKIAHSKRRAAR
jgi:simple sugar transport system permease protein